MLVNVHAPDLHSEATQIPRAEKPSCIYHLDVGLMEQNAFGLGPKPGYLLYIRDFEVARPFSMYGSFGCFFIFRVQASTPSTLEEIHSLPVFFARHLGDFPFSL